MTNQASPEERDRLLALRSLEWLDTPPTDSFDRVTRLAADALAVPIVLISLVDERRIWFKSHFGLAAAEVATEMSHSVSLCAHTVARRAPLVIADVTSDPRFAECPLVTGAPYARAYAGVPLLTLSGHAVGAICAIDTRTRDLDGRHLRTLQDYANIVEASIHAQELTTRARHQLHAMTQARDAERRVLSVVDQVPAFISYWNHDLQCEFANKPHQELFAASSSEATSRHMPTLLGEKVFARLEPHVRAVLLGHAQRFERTHRRADGTNVRLDVQYVPDEGRGFTALAVDVTASRAVHQALEVQNTKLTADSATDYLTGLANRRVFSERSELAWKRYKKTGEVCALILIDLDNFKQINDVHGHGAGDDVLRAMGALLKSQLRCPRDMAARLGGEEFAILCFGEMDEDLAMQIAERLRQRVRRESIDSGKFAFDFAASFGLAVSDSNDFGWKDIYSRADAALYEAKAAGKNQVKFGASAAMAQKQRGKLLRSKLLRSVPSE
jgi:diguanylate cyclase (GGDEF)-like protein